jgi:hypothetical protein
MIPRSADIPIISISTVVYEMLLLAYPGRFRREYGPHMQQVFRDSCLRAFDRAGAIGLVELWTLTLFDLARSTIEQHMRRETSMSHSNFNRLSGWALILAAATFFLFFFLGYLDETGPLSPSMGSLFTSSYLALVLDHPALLATGLTASLRPLYIFSYYAVILASPILLAIGLLGLRSRYGGSVGSFGKQALLVGVVAGLLVSLIGIVGEAVLSWDPAWFAQFAGPGVMLGCLALSGISALSSRPLPRWNALALLAGLWYPLLILYQLTVGLTGDERSGEGMAVYTLIMTVQCMALLMLGWVLQGDAGQEAANALPAAGAQ